MIPSLPLRVLTRVLSNQERNDCRNSLCIFFKLSAEGFAQKLLFTAYTDGRADREYHNRYQQPNPMTYRQTRCQHHAEHARVNRITHDTIRTFFNQFVSFDETRRQAPLLSQGANGRGGE